VPEITIFVHDFRQGGIAPIRIAPLPGIKSCLSAHARLAAPTHALVMILRRALLLAIPGYVLALAACRRAERAPAETRPLEPSDSVDPAFTACSKSCGLRSAKDRREARLQPGASAGDAVFCPVSGAVFRIGEKTPRREARGQVLYFCCESCAAWFTGHEAEVLAKRGIG
jgi:hypothetical protein